METDKASMLEEITEYVKFLQLQVKVLSMSRLGTTEAVVPLLMESQTESSGGLLLSLRSGLGSGRQRAGRGSLSSSEAQDGAAFEHEVAQLIGAAMKELRAAHFQW
ncbi:bHLH transcription factor RHL1-like [Miscanthus floridulus]|uniref:bHLH transcription factor RHL1-like n=1 Tax=Miscanthus floridulus TaxID=154761 RepID=UPI00345999FB